MKNFLIFIFSFFYCIKARIVYQCSRYAGMPEQCMNIWVDYYNNLMIDLWHCPMNKYCQVLEKNPGEEDTIGVCMYNHKKLYDQDECIKDAECASLNCVEHKCIGFKEGEYCTPNLNQCANDLVCKKTEEYLPYGEKRDVYKCTKLSKINETCETNDECDVQLICGNSSIYEIINLMNKNNIDDITKLKDIISLEEYLLYQNNSQKICINRSSIENGLPSSEPMACKSGDSMEIELFPNYTESICVSKLSIIKGCDQTYTCMIDINLGKYNKTNITQECMFSAIGNPFCPLNQKEKAWNNYLLIHEKYYTKNQKDKNQKKYHFPVYKDTFNEFEVSQAYWSYQLWNRFIEADSCTRDFFFLKSSDNKINYNYKYLGYIILFLVF